MLTTEQLVDLRAKAKAATPGPWANCDNVKELFDVPPMDWGLVYAKLEHPGFLPVKVICRATGYVSVKEENEAREHHRNTGKMKDPGQGGKNAAYIAAVNPATVLQLLDTIYLLNREASCLATWLANYYIDDSLLPEIDNGMSPPEPAQIREAARKAVKANPDA